LTHAGAASTARLIRWAFEGSPNKRVWPDAVTDFPRR
jgi:hypothetical protein